MITPLVVWPVKHQEVVKNMIIYKSLKWYLQSFFIWSFVKNPKIISLLQNKIGKSGKSSQQEAGTIKYMFICM